MSAKKSEKKPSNKVKKTKTNKKKFSEKYAKIAITIKLFILGILFITVIFAGIAIGTIYGLWGDELKISEEELVIGSSNSRVIDSEGNQLAELIGDENRKIIKLDQIPENLKNAYVAIEDERFYMHSGVDFKRTGAAIFQYIISRGNSSFGGSTITQQLVKNITEDDERKGTQGIIRKIKEWAKAYQIERMISKDQILELYLNIIFVGGNNNLGVEVGSEYYFNKPAVELDLAECAFLAGINNSPNSYNPYGEKDNSEKIKKRTETVLKKMLELGKIEQQAYDEAYQKVENGLVFQKKPDSTSVYSYHTDATIAKVIEDIAQEKQISTSLASTYVYTSGLTIYSTQNLAIQEKMDDVMVKNSISYVKKAKGKTSQAAMVIIDNETGYVVGLEGGLGPKTESRGLNRATQSIRQTGSSIKPLTSLVPGINEGIITASTVYNDCATEFKGKYTPKDYNAFKGLINVRSAITTSQNIPFIKIVTELTPSKATDYLQKMGVTTVEQDREILAAISIGGFTNGISPLEMAGAYATIANRGVYRTPLFYTKVLDSNGNVILEAKQRTEQVISEQAAYVIKDMLKSVVQSGTATYCKISGMDVAAKTGTTNSNYDKWLCGFTNYYTASCWYGYDVNEEVTGSTNWAGKIWSAVMTKVHSGKAGSKFIQPSGVSWIKVCRSSGKRATEKCFDTYSEVFVDGTIPEYCNGHSNAVDICQSSGLLANQYCPNHITKYYSYAVEKEKLGLWKNLNALSGIPGAHCTEHTEAVVNQNVPEKKITLSLIGESSVTINMGENYVEKGATAKDENGNDITSKITISGTVNTTKEGAYVVTYKVISSSGKEETATRTISVKAKEKPQITPPPVKEEKPNENVATSTEPEVEKPVEESKENVTE